MLRVQHREYSFFPSHNSIFFHQATKFEPELVNLISKMLNSQVTREDSESLFRNTVDLKTFQENIKQTAVLYYQSSSRYGDVSSVGVHKISADIKNDYVPRFPFFIICIRCQQDRRTVKVIIELASLCPRLLFGVIAKTAETGISCGTFHLPTATVVVEATISAVERILSLYPESSDDELSRVEVGLPLMRIFQAVQTVSRRANERCFLV